MKKARALMENAVVVFGLGVGSFFIHAIFILGVVAMDTSEADHRVSRQPHIDILQDECGNESWSDLSACGEPFIDPTHAELVAACRDDYGLEDEQQQDADFDRTGFSYAPQSDTGRQRYRAFRSRGAKGSLTKRLVRDALNWLSQQQRKDGSFFDGNWADSERMVSLTGLAALAFMGANHSQGCGQHKRTVRKSLRWLTKRQSVRGRFGRSGVDSQAIATVALADSVLLLKSPLVKRPLETAFPCIAEDLISSSNQLFDRHVLNEGFQRSRWSELAFLMRRVWDDRHGAHFRLSCPRPQGGWFSEPLFCDDFERLFFDGLALKYSGHEAWPQWKEDFLSQAHLTQNKGEDDPSLKGSWDPVGPEGDFRGRLLTTMLVTLCLEIDQRYLLAKSPRISGQRR